MISTYVSDSEFDLYESVEDKELNELFQEVRAEFNNLYYIQTREYDRRNWWGKLIGDYRKTGKIYTLYARFDFDTQIINFCQDHEWSLNTIVTKSYIMTFFFGLLAGKKYGKETRREA